MCVLFSTFLLALFLFLARTAQVRSYPRDRSLVGRLLLDLVATMAAVVVLGNVQLGYWGSSTHGQEHLGDLGSGRVLQVAVLAGVQKSGTGRLDRPTWTRSIAALLTVALLGCGVALLGCRVALLSGISIQMLGCGVALLRSRVALLLVVTSVAIARVQQNRAQVLATAITGSAGDDLHGSGSSSAGSSSTTSVLTLSIAGELTVGLTTISTLSTVSTVSTTIAAVAAAESQSGAEEDCESLLEKSIEDS